MDISIIPTIQRLKKPSKPRYIKLDSVKRLEADYLNGNTVIVPFPRNAE